MTNTTHKCMANIYKKIISVIFFLSIFVRTSTGSGKPTLKMNNKVVMSAITNDPSIITCERYGSDETQLTMVLGNKDLGGIIHSPSSNLVIKGIVFDFDVEDTNKTLKCCASLSNSSECDNFQKIYIQDLTPCNNKIREFMFLHNVSVTLKCSYNIPPRENGLYTCIREYEDGHREDCHYNIYFKENQKPISLVSTENKTLLSKMVPFQERTTMTSTTAKSRAKPELYITKPDPIIAGLEGILRCTSKGEQQSIGVYWTEIKERIIKETERISNEDNVYILKNTIKFKSVKEDNNKIVWCKSKEFNETKVDIRLNVKYGPDKVHVDPNKKTIPNGEFLKESFICAGDGNPSLSFKWFFKGVNIGNGSEFSLNKMLTSEDNGTYYCEAYNEINKTTVPLIIKVLESPIISIKILIMISVGTVFVFLLLTMINIMVCKLRNRKTRNKSSELYDDNIDDKSLDSTFTWCRNESNKLNEIELTESPDCQITSFFPDRQKSTRHIYDSVNEAIGAKEIKGNADKIPNLTVYSMEYLDAGNFAIVYKGKCQINDKITKKETVAVKIQKDFVNWTNPMNRESDFFLELDLHYRLPAHDNVIRCFGMSVNNGATGMVLEYAGNGTLKTFLQLLYKKEVRKIIRNDDKCIENLNIKCMKFAKEVSAGMAHIAKNKIVHRDLAARNILMTVNDICKISDLGLARLVHSSSEYKMSSNDTIPIRWLSPESFFYNTYSEKSDVWSFGILLWEIIALGGTPYHNLKTGNDVKTALESGYRMSPPRHCSHELYNVMKYCWEEEPEERPKFDKLEDILSNYLVTMKNHINFKDFDSKLYDNMDLHIYRENMIE